MEIDRLLRAYGTYEAIQFVNTAVESILMWHNENIRRWFYS